MRLEITVSFGKFCILVSSIYIRPIDLTLLVNGYKTFSVFLALKATDAFLVLLYFTNRVCTVK